ncbi:helicase-associated domain-containing protein [Microbacterium sp. No. 7]|uniref:helicase-associated domain-containing protein n=1 Tax=Microbacterium sp. No. 7 TaxID=1714373 RepID=UPI0006D1622B|nr:helicase-associated domain-containing protein [Microbacterium sp. No. 7]ALJ19661.1 hypothetical protein AOA12_06965 [Microbacterium sp. No. 7]
MTVSATRTLATWLASLSDADLAALLTARSVAPATSLADLYDLAELLLEPGSILRGLQRLSAVEADDLARARDGATLSPGAGDRLRRLALVDGASRVYGAVAEVMSTLPAPAPPPADADDGIAEPETDAFAAERAFTATTSLADVLQAAQDLALHRIASGALGAADRRRLVEVGAVGTPDVADELVAVAETAGLLAGHDRRLVTTPTGRDWLALGTAERWRTVAARLRAGLPAALRTSAGGWIEPSRWRAAYPYDPAWPEQAARWRRSFARWAITDAHGRTSSWARGFADGGDVDEGSLRQLLPPEVDRVFLQNDLTAIAPGPLVPRIDRRLRRAARRESRAQASTFRFTAETIAAALDAGESAASLHAFLSEISLTGVPQPLAYEIERCAARHGGVRVSSRADGGTRVSGLPDLLDAIEIDQALRPLGLVRDGDGLVTRSSPEIAFRLIGDARYPVVAALGHAAPAPHAAPADEPASSAASVDGYAPLIARLRAGHGAGTDAAWLGRELEQAVRERAAVTVVVRLPDGTEHTLNLELTGVGGGRLRGLDRGADVERTLPVSSIVSVRPA